MRERVLLDTFRGLVWVGVKVLSAKSVHSVICAVLSCALVQNMIII
jgi:hypothetical protein